MEYRPFKFRFDLGRQLAEALIPDDIRFVIRSVDHLIIIPDECLGLLPFEALVIREGENEDFKPIPLCRGGEFFGDHRTISYYQSVSALTIARRRTTDRSDATKALLIANPEYAARSGYQRLPNTCWIGNELETLLPGNVETFMNARASKGVFVKEIKDRLPDFHTVVFGVHGNYDGRECAEPMPALGPSPDHGDALTMSDVMRLKMNADLVALVACMSGLGETLYGEGVMGMGRAFQCAGARNVLMSLWSVDEKSSVALVNHFLRFRGRHGDAQALKLARAKVREDGWDHPLFWAPFVLVGDAGPQSRAQ